MVVYHEPSALSFVNLFKIGLAAAACAKLRFGLRRYKRVCQGNRQRFQDGLASHALKILLSNLLLNRFLDLGFVSKLNIHFGSSLLLMTLF
jgi:hypothetical protein